MAENQNTQESCESSDWAGGTASSPEWHLGRGCTFRTPALSRALTRVSRGSCCCGRAAPPPPAGWAGSRRCSPAAPLSWKQTNTFLHTCFNHSLNVNMDKTQEMKGWLLTFPPCNAHILRASTGILTNQRKHTKKGQVACPHIRNKLFNFLA